MSKPNHKKSNLRLIIAVGCDRCDILLLWPDFLVSSHRGPAVERGASCLRPVAGFTVRESDHH